MLFWCCSSLHQSWCSVSGFDKAWPSSNPKITFILQIPEPPRHLAATGCFFYFVCCQYLLFFRVCGMVKHATFVIVPPHPRAQLSGLSPAPLCLAFALSLSKKKKNKKAPGKRFFPLVWLWINRIFHKVMTRSGMQLDQPRQLPEVHWLGRRTLDQSPPGD